VGPAHDLEDHAPAGQELVVIWICTDGWVVWPLVHRYSCRRHSHGSYVQFGLASLLIPFAASWHPVAVALGVVSLYLLAAVEVTSLVRKHLSHRLWKRVHFLSLPLFVLSTIHGLSAGTDGRTPMAIVTAGLVASGVGALVAVRIRENSHPAKVNRPTPTTGRPAAGRPDSAGRMVAKTPVGVG
jgi:DMSO/TMAO reductase YedYZ heme-binding membrane subunit